MSEEQILIWDYLKGNAIGYNNRKSSTQIREACNLDSGGATNEHVRDLIRDMILNHGCCIGSLMWQNGYWIIQTQQELDTVVNSLESRAGSISNRANALTENFNSNTHE